MLELAICDDDIILCNWLEQKLLHYGKANDCQISVEIYYSAEQLLNRLEEESYDMLFLDICLEHENGIDIGTEIRKKNYGKELRITYISTYQEYAMKLFRIHPFDFLVKPIREEELFRVIGELRELLKERKKIFEYTDTKRVLLQQRITKEIRPFIIMMISTAQHPLNIRMEQPVKRLIMQRISLLPKRQQPEQKLTLMMHLAM